jgi:hypothetical protein
MSATLEFSKHTAKKNMLVPSVQDQKGLRIDLWLLASLRVIYTISSSHGSALLPVCGRVVYKPASTVDLDLLSSITLLKCFTKKMPR